jgi:hypothetical protein
LDVNGQVLPKADPLGSHCAKENPKVTTTMTSADGGRVTRTSDFGMRTREVQPPPAGTAALRLDFMIHLPEGKQVHSMSFKVP